MNKKRQIPEVETLSEETKHLFDILNGESDLACVLIATSYLDYALACLLKRYFIESRIVDKLLNPPGGALSTFASRADLAYSLGLIPKGLYRNLGTIGDIRNAFAHSHLSLGLDDSDIASLVDLLIPPKVKAVKIVKGDDVGRSGPVLRLRNRSHRDQFNLIVVVMVNRLLLTGLTTKHREKEVKGWE